MNIKDMTTVELKAFAYDELFKIENSQNNLKIINQEIASRVAPVDQQLEASK